MTAESVRMRDGPPVTELLTRAVGGEEHAWDALVERYIPLVWSICRRYQLDNADARDVGQAVWRQLAGHSGAFGDPAELAGWLAITTERECKQVRRAPSPGQMPKAANIRGEQTRTAEQELLMAERHAALREAFAHLPPHCQQLIAMLIQDPPVPDAEISAELGIPAPSISENCRTCLHELRRHAAIATLPKC